MKARRVIYLLAFLLVGFIVFKYGQGNEITPAPSISKQDVLKDFADLKDNQDIPDGTLGGSYYTTAVFFPDDYVGDRGDEFYVSMEDGHVMLTQKYTIQEIGATKEKSGKLLYKVKDNWENFRPPTGKYETYKYDGQKWVKTEAPKQ